MQAKTMNCKTAKIFLIPAILFAVFFVFGNEARAANWYVSPTGSANCASGCLIGAPCSLATVLTCNVVGDNNVILKDGIYTGTSLTVPWSGTSGHPITIKAENDGQVTLVASGNPACYINYSNWIDLEGVICNGAPWNGAVNVRGASSHINIRRVSAISSVGNIAGFETTNAGSDTPSYVLFEDCAAYGNGRLGFNLYGHHHTLRRCWARVTYTNIEPIAFQIYGGSDIIIENCVGTMDSTSNSTWAYGIHVWCNDFNIEANRNKLYGNVVYNIKQLGFLVGSKNHLIEDNEFHNNVSIDSPYGFYQRADDNLIVYNLTIVNPTFNNFLQGQDTNFIKDPDWGMIGLVKNSSFTGETIGIQKGSSDPTGTTITSRYNNFYNVITQYLGTVLDKTGDNTLNPSYNTSTYGKGAYLMVPLALEGKGENGADIGAEVLYRYQDGVLTNVPLWPWPMEDRIKNETGYSVTYESGGGLWKTLDGVYSQEDYVPPAAPSGLTVN